MNKSETILLFQKLILELEQVKKMELNTDTRVEENKHNNQVIIDKKLTNWEKR
jgi:hypothetical protein